MSTGHHELNKSVAIRPVPSITGNAMTLKKLQQSLRSVGLCCVMAAGLGEGPRVGDNMVAERRLAVAWKGENLVVSARSDQMGW